MPEINLQNKKALHSQAAIKTVVFYAVIACLWIYFSDGVLAVFISDPQLLTKAQTIKGLSFVVITALLLYLYLTHCLQNVYKKEAELDLEQENIRKETQERLKQLSTLFDSMNAVVYVADIESYELLFVNQYAENYFGKNWENAKCYHYLQSGMEEPCKFCTNSQLIREGVAGEPVTWEFLNTKNNRWYSCFDKAIRWTDGRVARLEVAFDVTNHKELEKIKDDLLSSMSHEMRTPLTAISGFVELLLNDSGLSEDHRRHLEIVFREAEKLTELVNKLLDVRRLKTDRSRINYQSLTVIELIAKAKDGCHDCKPHHHIQVEGAPEISVYGNRKELVQVFRQIIDNACLYSPEGGDITAKVSADEMQVFIRFEDQGIGIPEHELELIFEPFHKLDRGDTRTTRGVGLGLSVARETIMLHGGQIAAESTPGQGSIFTVQLPKDTETV